MMLSGSFRLLASAAVAGGTFFSLLSAAEAQRRSAEPQRRAISEAQRRPAKSFCSEGRTASGACVNPAMAQAARQTACAATQGGLSRSAGTACASVGADRDYRYPGSVFADAYRNPAPPTHFMVPSTRYTTTY